MNIQTHVMGIREPGIFGISARHHQILADLVAINASPLPRRAVPSSASGAIPAMKARAMEIWKSTPGLRRTFPTAQDFANHCAKTAHNHNKD